MISAMAGSNKQCSIYLTGISKEGVTRSIPVCDSIFDYENGKMGHFKIFEHKKVEHAKKLAFDQF